MPHNNTHTSGMQLYGVDDTTIRLAQQAAQRTLARVTPAQRRMVADAYHSRRLGNRPPPATPAADQPHPHQDMA
jgi:hypothetical protein